MRIFSFAGYTLLALLTACQSVEWSESDSLHGMQWRDRQAYVHGTDVVLASDESSAQQTIEGIIDLRSALLDQLGEAPGPMIWVSMGPKDEPLAADPMKLAALLGKTSDQGKLELPMPDSIGFFPDEEPGTRAPTEAEREQLMAWITLAQAKLIDIEQNPLGLPEALVRHADGAFLYPTDAGLEASASGMLDLILAMKKQSMAESLLISMMRGRLVDKLAGTLVEPRQLELYKWLIRDLPLSPGDKATRDMKLAQVLGLTESEDSPLPRNLSMAEFIADPETFFPEDRKATAICWTGMGTKVELDDTIGMNVTLESHSNFNIREGRAPSKLIFMSKGAIQRADLNWIFDKLDVSQGRILVRASSHNLAAAFATLYAIERRALPPAAARTLWESYGMQPIGSVHFDSLRKFFRDEY